MIVDTLCGIVERHLPDLMRTLEESKVFLFPGRAHEVLPKEYGEEDIRFLREEFFLPFSTVCVEDTISCVILQDTEKDQRGIGGRRRFIEGMRLHTPASEFPDAPANIPDLPDSIPEDTLIVSVGMIRDVKAVGVKEIFIDVCLDGCAALSKTKGIIIPGYDLENSEHRNAIARSAGRSCMTALEEILYFNTPTRFILEDSPVKQRKHIKGRIPRTPDRPTYIFLTPHEIRARMKIGDPEAATGKVTRHEVRRHTRLLSSPKFKNKRWQTITVPAYWAGVGEAIIGQRRYRVRLDL